VKPILHSSQNQTRAQQKNNYKAISLMNLDAKILNIGKPNSTTYQKDHTPLLSQFNPRDTVMVQHMQIIECNTKY
jgi:hypothetical protein